MQTAVLSNEAKKQLNIDWIKIPPAQMLTSLIGKGGLSGLVSFQEHVAQKKSELIFFKQIIKC